MNMKRFPLSAITASMALLPFSASAHGYNFNLLTTPDTFIIGMNNAGDMVVDTRNNDGTTACALVQGDNATPIANPVAPTYTWCSGISMADEIVGYTLDINDFSFVGYTYSGGTFTQTTEPVAGASPYGISEDGNNITGNYLNDSGVFSGYTIIGSKIKTFEAQGAISTYPVGINDKGLSSGWAETASGGLFGYLLKGKTFTTLSVPDSVVTLAEGINNKGVVAGYYQDTQNVIHGFIYNSKKDTYTTVDVPNTLQTIWFGITDKGTLYGVTVVPGGKGTTYGVYATAKKGD